MDTFKVRRRFALLVVVVLLAGGGCDLPTESSTSGWTSALDQTQWVAEHETRLQNVKVEVMFAKDTFADKIERTVWITEETHLKRQGDKELVSIGGQQWAGYYTLRTTPEELIIQSELFSCVKIDGNGDKSNDRDFKKTPITLNISKPTSTTFNNLIIRFASNDQHMSEWCRLISEVIHEFDKKDISN